MTFTDTEIRNFDSSCDDKGSDLFVQYLYKNFSDFSCGAEFSPYELSEDYRKEFIEGVLDPNYAAVS